MDATKWVLGYLKSYNREKLVYDTSILYLSEYKVKQYTWFQLYPNAQEYLPSNTPSSKGKPVFINGYYNTSHASYLVARYSVMSILLYMNNTLIDHYSKRRDTVKPSTYSSELMAGRVAMDHIMALQYDLPMLGVVINGTSILFDDNLYMVTSVSFPKSCLKKKHNSIAYHRCSEAVATKVISFVHCYLHLNHSDSLTKALGP